MTIPRDIPVSTPGPSHSEFALLAAIMQATEDAIIGLDADAIITFWNRGAEVLYDYPSEEILGQSFRQLVPYRQRTMVSIWYSV